MFTDLKPYPAYVDSGNQWFGHIPVSWETSRLRGVSRLFVSNVDKLTQEEERPVRLCNYVDVYKNEIITDRPGYMTASASDDEIRRFRVRVDDVVITKDSESWTDIGVPAYVAQEADDLVCGYHLGLLRTRKDILTGAYLFRALQVPAIATQFHVAACGVTRYGLSQDDILSVIVPIPSLSEQTAIVKYLGHETTRIDRAIAVKRKLIALLEEQQQAVINQAVTRGIDPNIPMKQSGIDWMGEVPEHWLLGRLKNAANIRRGRFTARPRNDPTLYDGPYPFIQTGSIARADRYVTSYEQTLNDEGLAVSELFPAGTLVMAIAANIGDVAILGFDTCIPDSIISIVPRVALDPAYLYFLLRSLKRELESMAPVNTQGNLSVERVASLPMPMPPHSEQRVIARHIEAKTTRICSAIRRARREIELLQEFRTRLSADVVTGQVDIRAAAARLPELDLSDLVSDVGESDEDDLDAEGAESLDAVDA